MSDKHNQWTPRVMSGLICISSQDNERPRLNIGEDISGLGCISNEDDMDGLKVINEVFEQL